MMRGPDLIRAVQNKHPSCKRKKGSFGAKGDLMDVACGKRLSTRQPNKTNKLIPQLCLRERIELDELELDMSRRRTRATECFGWCEVKPYLCVRGID